MKNAGLFKTCVLTGKKFEDFRQKKRTETNFSTFQKHLVEHTAPKYNIVFWQVLFKL